MKRSLFQGLVAVVCLIGLGGGVQAGMGGGKKPSLSKTSFSGECAGTEIVPSLRCAKVPAPFFDNEGRLWLAWTEKGHVYVGRSGDEGRTFSSIVRVTSKVFAVDKNGENRPKVVVARDGGVYVTFTAKGERRYTGNVFFSRSLDGGMTFSEPVSISDEKTPTSLRFETMVVGKNGRITIAWIDKRDGTAAKKAKKKYTGAALYTAYSTDRGASFSPNIKVIDHSCECCRVAMTTDSDGLPVVVWRNIFGKNVRDHAVMKIKADGSPGPVVRLSEDNWAINACPHHGPAISIGNNGVQHVVWFTQGKARKGIFHARSEDGGKTFSKPFGFGNPDNRPAHPHVLSVGGRVFLAWKEFSGRESELYVMESPDEGRTWSVPMRVAATADASDHPFLIENGRWVYVSWATAAEGWRLLKIASIAKGKGK